MTVKFRGEERTLVQMGRFLEEPDRALRQEAWELVAKRRLAGSREVRRHLRPDGRVCASRSRTKAGFDNYVDYAFRARERFDYTADDAVEFHDAIENEVVPARPRAPSRAPASNSARRAPAVGPGRRSARIVPPLRPFDQVETMVERHPGHLRTRRPRARPTGSPACSDASLLDLANRKGKAPGGYQTTLEDDRLPFIFMNAVGVDGDVRTLLHEGGHAFHALATPRRAACRLPRAPRSSSARSPRMSMELLGARNLDVFYSPTRTPTAPTANCSKGSS